MMYSAFIYSHEELLQKQAKQVKMYVKLFDNQVNIMHSNDNFAEHRLEQQLERKDEELERLWHEHIKYLTLIRNLGSMYYCGTLHSLKAQLYGHKQRQEGHYTSAEGSMHDKLQEKYHHFFLYTANPLAKELSKSSGTMTEVEAKHLLSIIFEVSPGKKQQLRIIMHDISLYHTMIKLSISFSDLEYVNLSFP